MKKFLLIPLLLALCNSANAQHLTIVNNTDFAVTLTVYAQAPLSYGGGCGGFVSNTITITSFATEYWSDPCDFETSTTYCSGCVPGYGSSAVGWASWPGMSFTSFCSGIPADFKWTAAYFDVAYACPGDYTGTVGDNVISCFSSSAYTCCGGCLGTGYVTWSPAACYGSPGCNATITINPY